jgi:hypothetical protein
MRGNDEARMTNDEGMTKSEEAPEDSLWLDGEMSLVREESDPKPVYDLEERTARFGEMVVGFARTIPRDPVTDRIISQLVGAGTSIGVNLSRLMIRSRKKNFSSVLAPARRRRVKLSIFCVWPSAPFQN